MYLKLKFYLKYMALYEFFSKEIYDLSNINGQIIKDNLDIIHWNKLVDFMKDRNKNKNFIGNIIKKDNFTPLVPAHKYALKIQNIKFFEIDDDNIYIFSRDHTENKYCLYLFCRNLYSADKIVVVRIYLSSDTVLCPNFYDDINSWIEIQSIEL